MSAVINNRTNDALVRVMRFFGIDDYNRPLFGAAASAAGVEAFAKVVEALDGAIASDSRNRVSLRIRDRIEREKRLKGQKS